jgi:hypothetical protein
MTKSFLVVLAFSFMLLSLMSCQTQQGVTLSVSMTGEPNGIQTNVGLTNTIGPSIYYRGTASALLLTYNVLSAPQGGAASINPRSQVVTVSGSGATVLNSTLTFDLPGTYIVQVVVQEDGTGDLSASDQTTFVVLPAVASPSAAN